MQGEALKKHMIDTTKEWQMKIGYMAGNNMELYYPSSSLAMLLGLKETASEEEINTALGEYAEETKDIFGELEVSHKGERYCITIPPQGCAYIAENVPEPEFLKGFLKIVASPDGTLQQVRDYFKDFAKKNHAEYREEDGAHDDMGRIFYFTDKAVDAYYYCVEVGELGLAYHRFDEESYLKMRE